MATPKKSASETTEDDENLVKREIERMRGFVKDLSIDDLRSGNWFPKLLTFALAKYTSEVDAEYFRTKYPDLPADAVAQARVQMAANYASIEGGLSALASTGAIAATIGSGGGASPLTLPAGGASFAIDLTYTSYLQLRMAYDISVLYGVPLDLNDPDDVWKLVRIAFAIKSGELGGSAALRGVPAVVRPAIKRIFSGSTLQAARSLPVIGKHLLQRNIIKIGLPGVSIPLAVLVNRYTTKVAGTQAIRILRREAQIIETATRLVARTAAHEELLLVMWLVMQSDGRLNEDERLLIHHTTAAARTAGCAPDVLDRFRSLIAVEETQVWSQMEDLDKAFRRPLYDAAVAAAVVDGKVDAQELKHLERLAQLCDTEHDHARLRSKVDAWK